MVRWLLNAIVVAVLTSVALADDGNSWPAVKLPEAVAGHSLHGVIFLDAKQGWLVGEKGLCLATQDGGATWKSLDTGSGATLRFVRFADAKNG